MAKTLIRGGSVVSMDPGIGTLSGGDLLIDGERIVDVGASIAAGDARIIDASDMIVMPGLVNAHLHTWQTGIRGLSADWSLSQYFRRMHRGMAASFVRTTSISARWWAHSTS